MNDIETTNIFYLFLQSLYFSVIVLIVYYSTKIGTNQLKSKQIFVIPAKTTCNLDSNLPQIKLNQDSTFNYKMLKFVTTTNSSEAGNYSTICNSSCQKEKDIIHNCNRDDKIFQSCIELLRPPLGCTNNSKPLGISDNKIIYAKGLE